MSGRAEWLRLLESRDGLVKQGDRIVTNTYLKVLACGAGADMLCL